MVSLDIAGSEGDLMLETSGVSDLVFAEYFKFAPLVPAMEVADIELLGELAQETGVRMPKSSAALRVVVSSLVLQLLLLSVRKWWVPAALCGFDGPKISRLIGRESKLGLTNVPSSQEDGGLEDRLVREEGKGVIRTGD